MSSGFTSDWKKCMEYNVGSDEWYESYTRGFSEDEKSKRFPNGISYETIKKETLEGATEIAYRKDLLAEFICQVSLCLSSMQVEIERIKDRHDKNS